MRSELVRRCKENRHRLPKHVDCDRTSTEVLLHELSKLNERPVINETEVQIGPIANDIYLTILFHLPLSVLRRVASLTSSHFNYIQKKKFWMRWVNRNIPLRHDDAVITMMGEYGWRRYAQMFERREGNIIDSVGLEGQLIGSRIDYNLVSEPVELASGIIGNNDISLFLTTSTIITDQNKVVPVYRVARGKSGLHYIGFDGRLYSENKMVLTEDEQERFIDLDCAYNERAPSQQMVVVTSKGELLLTDERHSYWFLVETSRPIMKALIRPSLARLDHQLHLIDIDGRYLLYYIHIGNEDVQILVIKKYVLPDPIIKVACSCINRNNRNGELLLTNNGDCWGQQLMTRTIYAITKIDDEIDNQFTQLPIIDCNDIAVIDVLPKNLDSTEFVYSCLTDTTLLVVSPYLTALGYELSLPVPERSRFVALVGMTSSHVEVLRKKILS